MNNNFFQTLLVKNAAFLTGESPSPYKLTAMYKQIAVAFNVLEKFIGNGTDYQITDSQNRKMLSNISSLIGKASNVYKPVNKVSYTEALKIKHFSGDGTVTYDGANKSLVMPAASKSITIDIMDGEITTFVYKSASDVDILYNGVSVGTLPATTVPTVISMPPASGDFTTLGITPAATLYLYSLAVGSNSIAANNGTHVVNTGQAIPLDNNKYWITKTSCKWANPLNLNTAEDRACKSKTCDKCIGNKYNMDQASADFGTVICDSPLDIVDVPIAGGYEPGSLGFITFQSPLLTIEKPNSAFAMQYSLFSNIDAGVKLQDNLLSLYDTTNTSIPIVNNISFYSASSDRGDILFTTNDIPITSIDKQYIVIGGDYGLADMLVDTLEKVKGY